MAVPSLPVIRHGCLLHSLAGADPRLQLLSCYIMLNYIMLHYVKLYYVRHGIRSRDRERARVRTREQNFRVV